MAVVWFNPGVLVKDGLINLTYEYADNFAGYPSVLVDGLDWIGLRDLDNVCRLQALWILDYIKRDPIPFH